MTEHITRISPTSKTLKTLDKSDMDKLLKAVEQFCESIYETTEIFIGNPFDLIEIDMSEIPSNCFFISEPCIERGVMYRTKDDWLKRELYKFIEEYPDRVFRGKK